MKITIPGDRTIFHSILRIGSLYQASIGCHWSYCKWDSKKEESWTQISNRVDHEDK